MDQAIPPVGPSQSNAFQEILGYLNFSNGTADPRFQRNLNDCFPWLDQAPLQYPPLYHLLLEKLQALRTTSPAFRDSAQAEQVLKLVFDEVLPAYRRFHADLLFHVPETTFVQPLFLARVCETVLSQGSPWDEPTRIVTGSLSGLNDFLGHRPLAVLENGRLMQPYSHERYRPIPLYLRGVGAARGKYHAVIEKALEILGKTSPDLLHHACFSFDQLEEIALDIRAYDQGNPVYKRTNYTFGEWDPHLIDSKGRYRRFVLRAIIMDALDDWLRSATQLPPEEALVEAGSVLAGTMLMASVVSGSGPDTHDSSVSLMSLLPQIARQRDSYYTQLLASLTGPHAERLRREAVQTQQPLGKTRQHLNLFLAHYGCRQMQRAQLAYLFARMGFSEAARQEAAVIPALSTRIETEIQIQLVEAHLQLDALHHEQAAARLPEIEQLWRRGIECGAIMDPWNLLGFSGHFPLFNTREDAIFDPRVDKLLGMMEQIFALYSRWQCEAAAAGKLDQAAAVTRGFRRLSEEWDRFASTTIGDLPPVSGQESYQSAQQVSQCLAEWSRQEESAGNVAFWKRHVAEFQSPKAYAMVIDILLRRGDSVATMNLLIQWLSQHDEVPLEAGPYSFYPHLEQWLAQTLYQPLAGKNPDWPLFTRFLDYVEANAAELWAVPKLSEELGLLKLDTDSTRGTASDADDLFDATDDPDDETELPPDAAAEEDDEKSLFSAAYEGVTFRESAQDGNEGDTLDGGGPARDSDLDKVTQPVEARLRFLGAVMQLWRSAAAAANLTSTADSAGLEACLDAIPRWFRRNEIWARDLQKLLEAVAAYEPDEPSGDPDSLSEFDRRLHAKFHLMNNVLHTLTAAQETSRLLRCWIAESVVPKETRALDRRIIKLYRQLLAGDVAALTAELPEFLQELERRPLLYVPLDRGGKPREVLAARNLLSLLRVLLSTLPRLGMFRETWHVLRTAYVMERTSPPVGTSVTEFDRLLEIALRTSLEALLENIPAWEQAAPFNDEQLVQIVRDITEMYMRLWLKHSATMRLSSVEFLSDATTWRRVKSFIKKYGSEVFSPAVLSGGNLRAIVHRGPEAFLEDFAENADPLKPSRLLEDLEKNLNRDDAAYIIDLVFRCVIEKFERYMEYNTTTTQSDYGEQLYTLLDFLRVEAAYERNAWNIDPMILAHEVLSRAGRNDAAARWEKLLAERTSAYARKHLQQLKALEKRHSIRLPSITDQLQERFIKPLSLDRLLALIPLAMREAVARQKASDVPAATPAPVSPEDSATVAAPQDGTADTAPQATATPHFDRFAREVETYLETSSGSALELQPWLQDLADEVHSAEVDLHDGPAPYAEGIPVPFKSITAGSLAEQLSQWEKPLFNPNTPA